MMWIFVAGATLILIAILIAIFAGDEQYHLNVTGLIIFWFGLGLTTGGGIAWALA